MVPSCWEACVLGECLAAARVMNPGSVCLLYPQPYGKEGAVTTSESSRSGQQQAQFGCYWAGALIMLKG